MRAVSIGTATLVASLFAILGSAQAATIHACVKPKSGTTRIVGPKAKCHHGETKLSWNTTGPRGPAGANGTNGAPGAEGKPGANGRGPAFGAGGSEKTLGEAPSLLFEKTIPPGDYVVSAMVLLKGEAKATNKHVDIGCFVVREPGTSLNDSDLTGKTVEFLSLGSWESPLAEESPTEFEAANTITLVGAVESDVTSTIGVACDDVDTSIGATTSTIFSELLATQVSSITV